MNLFLNRPIRLSRLSADIRISVKLQSCLNIDMQPPNSVKLNLKSNEVMDMQTKVLVGTYMMLKDESIWTAYRVSLLTPSAMGIPIRFEQSHVIECD